MPQKMVVVQQNVVQQTVNSGKMNTYAPFRFVFIKSYEYHESKFFHFTVMQCIVLFSPITSQWRILICGVSEKKKKKHKYI